MKTRPIGVAAVVLSAGLARGAIVYDAISASNWHSSLFSQDEFADDTTLATGAGTVIREVEVGVLRNSAFSGTYNGTMTVLLWADAGGTPGAFLGSATAPVSLSDDVPHVVAAEFAGVTATTATVWTGVRFTYSTQLGAGIVLGTAGPSVGSTTDAIARHYPDSSWGVTHVPASTNWIRINTVPGPGVLGVLGIGGVVVRRRRR